MICNECETVSYCTKHGCIPKQPAPVYVKTFHGGKPWPLHPELPPECQTEAEKRAYAFGWWKALEAQRALDKKAENARELGLDYEPATEESSAVAAPVQEPVAEVAGSSRDLHIKFLPAGRSLQLGDKLYTTLPAQPAPTVQEPVGTYGEIHESMQALLRSGLQSDQQIYAAMKDKPLYTTPPAQPAPIPENFMDALRFDVAMRDAAQPAVPDAFGTREGEHPEYIQGWNDCRAEMLRGMKP